MSDTGFLAGPTNPLAVSAAGSGTMWMLPLGFQPRATFPCVSTGADSSQPGAIDLSGAELPYTLPRVRGGLSPHTWVWC